MRSGNVGTLGETARWAFRYANLDGNDWSSSAIEKSESTTTYFLGFNNSGVYPSHGPNNRRNALPLRCRSTTAVGRAVSEKLTFFPTAISQITEVAQKSQSEKMPLFPTHHVSQNVAKNILIMAMLANFFRFVLHSSHEAIFI